MQNRFFLHSAFCTLRSAFLGTNPMTEILIEDSDFAEARKTMENTWAHAKGFLGWFSEVDHKRIGMRYIVTAMIFFALGGIEAALIRFQLSRPENHFLSPDHYNQIFTMHGTTMMFLFAVPVMEG